MTWGLTGKGPRGYPGDAGAQGEQGIQGIQGVQGVAGDLEAVNRGSTSSADFAKTDLTIDSGWHDLDLSGQIPEGATFVQLQVEISHPSAGEIFVLKEKDYASGYVVMNMHTQVAGQKMGYRFWIGVNANRIIEYKAATGSWGTIDITVVAWMV